MADDAGFDKVALLLPMNGATGSTGSPVARAIRAQREDTGAYVGGVISDATTVVVHPVTGENLPALVHHGVIPI